MSKDTRKILMVDDDPVSQFVSKLTLRRAADQGDWLEHSNGQDAIEYLHAHEKDEEALPDVILLDLNMPVMDGWEFLDAFARLAPTLPKSISLYVISSSLSPRDKARAKATGVVTEYLVKPLTRDKVMELMA